MVEVDLKLRVRAAVILVEQDKILLVKHVNPDTQQAWWIPPGGGFEAQDRSILDCARREVFEETGLTLEIERLIYLREVVETQAATHHLELFFLARNWQGELTIDNIYGAGPDEHLIQDLAWLGREEMAGLAVYPEHLQDGFWDDLAQGFPQMRYLGLSKERVSTAERAATE